MTIGNQRLQRQFDGLPMMGIVMPEACWAVSVWQSNKILQLIVASSWVFYLSDWRCMEPQTLKKIFKKVWLCLFMDTVKHEVPKLNIKLPMTQFCFIMASAPYWHPFVKFLKIPFAHVNKLCNGKRYKTSLWVPGRHNVGHTVYMHWPGCQMEASGQLQAPSVHSWERP